MAIREKRLDGEPEGSGPTSSDGSTSSPVSPFRRALDDYTDGLQSAWRPEVATNRVNEAFRSAPAAARGFAPPHPTDVASQYEQQAAFVRQLQDAWMPRETSDRFDALFTQYVNNLKAAWAQLDAERVTPAELATVAAMIAHGSNVLAVPLERRQEAKPTA